MLIGLHGYPGVGKDAIANILSAHGYRRLAFADKLRESLLALNPVVLIEGGRGHRLRPVVEAMGWDTAKRRIPEVRELLQRFGTEVGRELLGTDVWVDLAFRDAPPSATVITDVRFPNELAAVRSRGGVVVEVRRPGHGAVNDHASETRHACDYTLDNDGDIDALREKVEHLLWWARDNRKA
jgi:hypothetical protein